MRSLSDLEPCCLYLTHPALPHGLAHPHSCTSTALALSAAALAGNTPLAQAAWSQPRLSNGILSTSLGKGEFASGVVAFWWWPGDSDGK